MKKQRLIALAALLVPMASFAGSFEGPYVGAYLGQADARDKGTGYDQGTGALSGWSQKTTPDSTQYGLLGGYNWRPGNGLLLGVEADYEGRSGSGNRSLQKDNGVTSTDSAERTQLKSAASLRGRVGYVFDNRIALYATAGYAAASVKRTWYDTLTPAKESHTSWQDGWTAGVGVDYLFTNKIAARLEVRHSDYGTKKVSANLWGEFYKQQLTEDSVRIGLSYQF